MRERSLRPINYDEIANTYDQRYSGAYRPEGIAAKLLGLARDVRAERILEVGCGTGHWLSVLETSAQVYGMDSSAGILQKARERKGTYEADLARYPSPGTIVDWMITAGFESATWQVGESILDTRMGREVLPLPKNFTSQLSLLTPQAYRDRIARIVVALEEAEAAGETPLFHVDISLVMVTGRV